MNKTKEKNSIEEFRKYKLKENKILAYGNVVLATIYSILAAIITQMSSVPIKNMTIIVFASLISMNLLFYAFKAGMRIDLYE